MNRNEISELRRRLNPEKNNIPEILGCYVDTKGEIISSFRRPLISMPQEECEKYLNIFRKTLSGTPGKNLIDVEFDPYDVMNSENHKALMHLRETGLKDEEAVQDLFARIISALKMETNYLILLLCDSYDVPFKGRDDVKVDDASEEVFQYILCAICPVKPTKPALSYFASENEFHQREEDWVVAAPDVGFLFPAFDDRASNIYKTVFYARDAETRHEELTDELFAAPMPRPAMEQLAAFQSVLENALEASLRTAPARRQIRAQVYLHSNRLLLIQVENAYDGSIQEKNGVFQSTKHKGNGIGVQSVRRIAEKTNGACIFSYQNGVFSAKVMMHGNE